VALEDVSGDIDDYKQYVEKLAQSVLSVIGPYGMAFPCGPTSGLRATSGAILVYERQDA
jgi:hypothetical protein